MEISKNSTVNKCLRDLPILTLSLHNKILLPSKSLHNYMFIYVLKMFPCLLCFSDLKPSSLIGWNLWKRVSVQPTLKPEKLLELEEKITMYRLSDLKIVKTRQNYPTNLKVLQFGEGKQQSAFPFIIRTEKAFFNAGKMWN